MGHVHCEAECVHGVREDMYLLYTLQINIVGLMDAICNCLQFGIIRCSKTSRRLVVIEVPLMPEAEQCHRQCAHGINSWGAGQVG
jgi:hypothetical protein